MVVSYECTIEMGLRFGHYKLFWVKLYAHDKFMAQPSGKARTQVADDPAL